MKIAICLSGQLRTGLECIENQLRLFEQLPEVDIFVHTWSSNTNKRWNLVDGSLSTPVPENILTQYREKIKPKSMLIEDPSELKLVQSVKSREALHYSFMKSVHLKRQYEKLHNFEYDVVIKMRPDVIFDEADRLLVSDIMAVQKSGSLCVLNLNPKWVDGEFHDDVVWAMPNSITEKIDAYYAYLSGFADTRIPHTFGFWLNSKFGIHVAPFPLDDRRIPYCIYRKEHRSFCPNTQFNMCIENEKRFFGEHLQSILPSAGETSDYYS